MVYRSREQLDREGHEQSVAQFLNAFGLDSGAEILMYLIKGKRDTLLLATIRKRLEEQAEQTEYYKYHRDNITR